MGLVGHEGLFGSSLDVPGDLTMKYDQIKCKSRSHPCKSHPMQITRFTPHNTTQLTRNTRFNKTKSFSIFLSLSLSSMKLYLTLTNQSLTLQQ
jgi:hypothetical protein